MSSFCKLCNTLSFEMGNPTKLTKESIEAQLAEREQFPDYSSKIRHAQLHFRQLMSCKKTTIGKMLDRCFPKSADDQQNEDDDISKTRSRLFEECKTIFSKFKLSSPVQCHQCDKQLILNHYLKKRWDWGNIVDHACRHLGKAIYSCNHCNFKVSAKSNIQRHNLKIHQTTAKEGKDFTDLTPIYENEIKDWIKKCFVEGAQKDSSTNAIRVISKAENLIRGCLRESENDLKAQRHLLHNRLMKKFMGDDGKIRCNICSKMYLIKSSSSLNHAVAHVKKPMFKCKKCTKTTSTYFTMFEHVKRVHKLGLKGNYESREDEFHKEIMAMLKKCFDGKKN